MIPLDRDVRVLTLHQPWASLWALGIKTIETRSWSTKHRGWLIVHAGVHRPRYSQQVGEWWCYPGADEDGFIRSASRWEARRGWPGDPLEPERFDDGRAIRLPLGAVVGAAYINDVLPVVGVPLPVKIEWRAGTYELIGDGLFRWGYLQPGPARDCSDQLPYGDFTTGRFGWSSCQQHALAEPIPWKGGQGLRRAPVELIEAVNAQLPVVV